jgi:hypothetical protein
MNPLRRQCFRPGPLRNLVVVLGLATLGLPASTSAQTTTTFRGHTLGENWQTFIRTERGLCQIDQANARACVQAAAGKQAVLEQQSKENDAKISFYFEGGRFVRALALMSGPNSASLTFLDKTYGKPPSQFTDSAKGKAFATWNFADGGKVAAIETTDAAGRVTITIMISAEGASPEKKNLSTRQRTSAISSLDELGRRCQIRPQCVTSQIRAVVSISM